MPLTLQTPFNWLFKAYFKDGLVIEQTAVDVNPDSNQLKAVLERIDDLTAFGLCHIDGRQVVVVDLITGNFVVNDTPICLHNQRFSPERYKLNLVYFREKRESLTTNPAGDKLDEQSYVNRYFIGWETTVNNKNKQVTLAVG